MKGRIIFVMVILLFAIAVIFFSLEMTSFKAKFLPLVCGACLAVASIFRLFVELKNKDDSTSVRREIQRPPIWKHHFFVAYVWLISFFIMVYLTGFSVAIFIFVMAYVKSKRGGWINPMTLGFVTSGFVYGLFCYLLRLDLYPGLFYLLYQRYAL